jgi:prophage regulatory protein
MHANSTRILRMVDACAKTGLCASTIYALISRGLFPRPFQLVPGGRAVGWFEADLDRYLADRKKACNASSPKTSQRRGAEAP